MRKIMTIITAYENELTSIGQGRLALARKRP